MRAQRIVWWIFARLHYAKRKSGCDEVDPCNGKGALCGERETLDSVNEKIIYVD